MGGYLGFGAVDCHSGMLKPWFGSQCWRLGPKGTRLLCRAADAGACGCGTELQGAIPADAAGGEDPETLDAIVITHEHMDHVNGLAVTARKLGIPVYFTEATHRAWMRWLTPRDR